MVCLYKPLQSNKLCDFFVTSSSTITILPNVVIGTENVVTHALPNLSEEKKEEEKRGGKEGKSAFFLWTS